MEDYPHNCHMEYSPLNCYIVEDYLTNPYQLSPLPVSRLRSQSVSTKLGGQNTKQIRHAQSFFRFRSSSVSNKFPKLDTKQTVASAEEPGLMKTHVKDRLSSIRSRASSLSSYISSASSSSFVSSSLSLSSSPQSSENSKQFWNRYRRAPSRPSLGQLVRQVILPQQYKAEPETVYSEIFRGDNYCQYHTLDGVDTA